MSAKTSGSSVRVSNGSCSVLTFFKIRVVDFFSSQPSSFCFILSLFFIAATLGLLGLYIRGDHMPDLDAMKYWNAYVGKLGDSDFCFQQGPVQSQGNGGIPMNISSLCGSSGSFKWGCPDMGDILFGIAGVELNFSVHRSAVENNKNHVFYTSFTGKAVGAQVKEYVNYTRIESCIYLDIWIKLTDVNVTAACLGDHCVVPGCLTIAAPMDAIPTRMPHVHKNFTFAAQVLESKEKPEGCNCDHYVPEPDKLKNMSIIHDKKNCSLMDPNIVTLSRSSKHPAKGYGVINVELSDIDKSRASEHMYIAALAVALLGCAFVVGILLSPAPTTKKKSLA